MRQGGPNGRRPRSRHHGGGGPHQHQHQGGGGGGNGGAPPPGIRDNRPRSASALRHQNFDSNCNDLRVRGNAWQVYEKYQALARDAQSSGDRVSAENFLQHAEHYFRIIEAINEATIAEQRARGIDPNAPTPPFGHQPETPNNFYGGNSAQGPQQQPPGAPGAPATDGAGNVTPLPTAQQSQQAEVQRVTPPQANQSNAFFAADESGEEPGGLEPLVARR